MKAEVEYDPGLVQPADLADCIEDLGFSAEVVESADPLAAGALQTVDLSVSPAVWRIPLYPADCQVIYLSARND
ncbi:unnamed protein product [Dibothriocephalus latus]|uniref:Uncharacterized protein n=1 Tax=Dibothriocephalus latus TaxID=60516 RepID=A0A3P7MVR8_DIBLA|nr:unnamed protein product [Dibothriocephalus latus]